MPTRPKKKKPSAKVTLFPPVPRVPAPPTFPPDPRQQVTRGVLFGLGMALSQGKAKTEVVTEVEGFPASAVNLGALQEAMERGLRRFRGKALVERWEDVRHWLILVLRHWVQRRKEIRIERCDKTDGINVWIQTQDDHGYYEYEFDVFPAREH